MEIACPQCGAELSQEKLMCPNCGVRGVEIGLTNFRPDDKGKQYNPFSTNKPQFIQKNRPLQASKSDKKKRVKNVFVSEEMKQCPCVNKRKKNVDNTLDITKSCEDLAIDG